MMILIMILAGFYVAVDAALLVRSGSLMHGLLGICASFAVMTLATRWYLYAGKWPRE